MSRLHGWWHRLYVLARGERYARELDAEQRFHRELEAMSLERDGRNAYDAELGARRHFGNPTYYREEARRMTPLDWLDRVRQDVGYALRGLRRSPGFTATVIATLGLGLGVNAAMFSLLDRLFVRAPRGVVAPTEVRRLYHEWSEPSEPGGRLTTERFTYADFRAITSAVGATTAVPAIPMIAAFTRPESTVVVQADARRPVRQSLVTGDYFKLLGVRTQLGRFFADEETRVEAPTPVVVISDAFWRAAFDGDSSVIGRKLSINFEPVTVIGVAQRDFTGIDIDAVDIWRPANNYYESRPGRLPWYETYRNNFQLIARRHSAADEQPLLTIATRAIRTVRLENYNYDSTAAVLAGPIIRAIGPVKQAQEVVISTRLGGVALIVLVIACANVANLLLVRATRRRREIAVRRALGVSRARLCEQLITESLLLAALAGTAALLFAVWAGTAVRRLLLPNVQWSDGAVDLRTLVFVAAASTLVGLVAGVVPAWHATNPNLQASLKAGGRDSAYRRSTVRSALLVAQAALSVVLLVGAGLFVKSLRNVHGLDLGYDVEGVMLVRPGFGRSAPPPEVIAAAIPEVAQRLSAVPGVEAIGYASAPPMRGISFSSLFLPGRDSLPKYASDIGPGHISVSPGYVRAAGLKLLIGRDFTAADQTDPPGAVIVGSAMARTYWPGESALGKCVILDKRSNPCSLVIGVVADMHRLEVIEQPTLQYFVPITPASDSRARDIILRANARHTEAIGRVARQELARAFPTMTTPLVRTLAQALEPQYRPWRLGATLFAAFGLLALVVAAIGVYSVVAYAVSQRTHEMGVRIALGARLADILNLVVAESAKVVAFGVALGVVAALALGRLVASLLYGITARDPVVLTGSAMVLCAIGIVASLVPAWRAARVDPATALRAE